MKKVNIYLMNKGGVGKTPLVIFTMLKLIKEGHKDFKMVDCDSNNHSFINRFRGTDYEKYIAKISLAKDENSNMDFSALEGFFETLSSQNYKSYYVDFGQDDSNALIKLIKSVGIDGLYDYLADLKIELTLCPVVAVGDRDSITGLQTLIDLNDSKFKITPYANMLNAANDEDPNLLSLKEQCNTIGLDLHIFNRPNIPDGFKASIHNYLVSGLTTNLGLAKGLLNNILEALTIA